MAQGLLLSFKKASKLRLIKVNERERERERVELEYWVELNKNQNNVEGEDKTKCESSLRQKFKINKKSGLNDAIWWNKKRKRRVKEIEESEG